MVIENFYPSNEEREAPGSHIWLQFHFCQIETKQRGTQQHKEGKTDRQESWNYRLAVLCLHKQAISPFVSARTYVMYVMVDRELGHMTSAEAQYQQFQWACGGLQFFKYECCCKNNYKLYLTFMWNWVHVTKIVSSGVLVTLTSYHQNLNQFIIISQSRCFVGSYSF